MDKGRGSKRIIWMGCRRLRKEGKKTVGGLGIRCIMPVRRLFTSDDKVMMINDAFYFSRNSHSLIVIANQMKIIN